MKIIASVSVEIKLEDTELLDDGKERAIDKLIDTLDDLEDVQNVYSNYKIKGN